MNFKEALIAHLQGETVEFNSHVWGGRWIPINELLRQQDLNLQAVLADGFCCEVVFRLAPRTIIVNGVEVPAGEEKAPNYGENYLVPHLGQEERWCMHTWKCDAWDLRALERGLVYLNKDDAIARTNAMLLTSDK